LIGNWVEERQIKSETLGSHIEDDTRQKKRPISMAVYHSNHYGDPQMMFMGGDLPEKVQDAHLVSRKNEHKGMFLHHTEEDKIKDHDTTHRDNFRPPNHSGNKIGARTKLMEQHLMKVVKDELAEEQREEERHFEESRKNLTSTYHQQFSDTNANSTKSLRGGTLDNKIEIARAKLESVAPSGDTSRYDQDTPISVYTEKVGKQGPNQLGTGIYHSATTGNNPFAKNTSFSQPISEYSKSNVKDH
jgi:uncharacterized membrane-anchored protein YhcB (DUF1043 family)